MKAKSYLKAISNAINDKFGLPYSYSLNVISDKFRLPHSHPLKNPFHNIQVKHIILKLVILFTYFISQNITFT